MSLLDQILGASGLGGGTSRQPGSMGGGVLMALLPVVMGMLSQRAGGAAAGGTGGSGALGGLGSILGSLGASGGQSGGMGGMGGIGALIEQFTNKGYGQHATSWIGTGPNEALPPQAVSEVFGEEQLARIAQQAGVSTDDARNGMSELLPGLVDHFTPEGQVPGLDRMSASVDDFVRRMNA